jgi:hypothetical protein
MAVLGRIWTIPSSPLISPAISLIAGDAKVVFLSSVLMEEHASARAWQVLAGSEVLSGGDWPGEYNYWTTEEKAKAHAFTNMSFGRKNVTVIEVDPPLISRTDDQPKKTEEEDLFVKWVTKIIAENYPDKARWPDFVLRLYHDKTTHNLPKFGCLSELEWLRYQEESDIIGSQSVSWLDKYESDSDIWDELIGLSQELTHYCARIGEDDAKLVNAERFKIIIQTRDIFVAHYTKTKKAGLEKIAALMAKHPVEIAIIGGLKSVDKETDELKQDDLRSLNFSEWLEKRWKDTGLYETCPEYLKMAESTGDPKDLPLTVWPEWLEYRNENNAEERNRRRRDPELNADVWEDHVHRMMKYRRSRWKGEIYFLGERGGVYRINGAGRREYL